MKDFFRGGVVMIIRIEKFDIPIIRKILGDTDIARMDGIEIQAVKGKRGWNDSMGEFSSKGMKKGDKFYFVPFSNIYGMAEDIGYNIFEKLYEASDLIHGIVVSSDVASIIAENKWRVFSYGDRKENIPLFGGGGYILKIDEVNFSALIFGGDQVKNAMRGLIVQGWGVERGILD